LRSQVRVRAATLLERIGALCADGRIVAYTAARCAGENARPSTAPIVPSCHLSRGANAPTKRIPVILKHTL
jgi:hypothetical protein